jgi:hypothetical protein
VEVVEMTSIGIAEEKMVKKRESESRKLDGLCVTCEHAPKCVFAQPGIQPVVFCEEYDEEQVFNVRTSNIMHRRNQRDEPDISLKGLCVNCSGREGCAHPKQATGIWYCEDYT